MSTGKFCRLFGPVSGSLLSLGVIPALPRSIPRPSLPKISLSVIWIFKPGESPAFGGFVKRTPAP